MKVFDTLSLCLIGAVLSATIKLEELLNDKRGKHEYTSLTFIDKTQYLLVAMIKGAAAMIGVYTVVLTQFGYSQEVSAVYGGIAALASDALWSMARRRPSKFMGFLGKAFSSFDLEQSTREEQEYIQDYMRPPKKARKTEDYMKVYPKQEKNEDGGRDKE